MFSAVDGFLWLHIKGQSIADWWISFITMFSDPHNPAPVVCFLVCNVKANIWKRIKWITLAVIQTCQTAYNRCEIAPEQIRVLVLLLIFTPLISEKGWSRHELQNHVTSRTNSKQLRRINFHMRHTRTLRTASPPTGSIHPTTKFSSDIFGSYL